MANNSEELQEDTIMKKKFAIVILVVGVFLFAHGISGFEGKTKYNSNGRGLGGNSSWSGYYYPAPYRTEIALGACFFVFGSLMLKNKT